MPLKIQELGHAMQAPTPKFVHKRQPHNKVSGSLSDGSVCEYPPLNKSTLRMHELQTQSIERQKNIKPEMNIPLSRKRQTSSGDREHTGSSGYETGPKRMKQNFLETPTAFAYPVMENRISSTNDKFAGAVSPEAYEVMYTRQEKIYLAALAIVYYNCKIVAEKFVARYHKQPPHFQTIFAWRQRLLMTGCMVDSHLEQKQASVSSLQTNEPKLILKKPLKKLLPNPEEIALDVLESDVDLTSKPDSRHRSVSVETLLIDGVEKVQHGSVSAEDNHSRSHSESTHRRMRSHSLDSSDSSSDSDLVESPAPVIKPNTAKGLADRNLYKNQKVNDGSDSDSKSCCSEETDFLSRNYRKKRKSRPNPHKSPEIPKPQTCTTLANTPPIAAAKGYSTLKPDVSPLVIGNIYTGKLPNMVAKQRKIKTKPPVETDGYGSEYVPTHVGTSTKNNYQAFKQNVMKKGYWAKANGCTLSSSKVQIISDKLVKKSELPALLKRSPLSLPPPAQPVSHVAQQANTPVINPLKPSLPLEHPLMPAKPHTLMPTQPHTYPQATLIQGYVTAPLSGASRSSDLKKATSHQYTSFNHTGLVPNNVVSQIPVFNPKEPPPKITPVKIQDQVHIVTSPRNTSCVFDAVQSNSDVKNKSILDIFGNNDTQDDKTSPQQNGDNVRKTYEVQWDDDDEALYKTDDPAEETRSNNCRTPSPVDQINSVESTPQTPTAKRISMDTVKERRDQLLCLMKQDTNMSTHDQLYTPEKQVKHASPHKLFQQKKHNNIPNIEDISNIVMFTPPAIPQSISNEIIGLSEQNSFGDDRHVSTPTIPLPTCEVKSSSITSTSSTQEIPAIPSKLTHGLPSNNVQMIQTHSTSPRFDATSMSSQRSSPTYELQSSPTKRSSAMNKDQTIYERRFSPNYYIPPSPSRRSSNSHHGQTNLNDCISPTFDFQSNSARPSPISCEAKTIEHQESTTQKSTIVQETGELSKTQTMQIQAQIPQMELSNFLTGINTNTLLLALQNLQHLAQNTSMNISNQQNDSVNNKEEVNAEVETINLTNDEDWEKESNDEESIEKQLERMDGNTGDTPFLSDIFDPGPVIMPNNIVKKLNINLKKPEENKTPDENAPVIGNFKSFALPKPVLLEKLKVPLPPKRQSNKRMIMKLKKKKVCMQYTPPILVGNMTPGVLTTHIMTVGAYDNYIMIK